MKKKRHVADVEEDKMEDTKKVEEKTTNIPLSFYIAYFGALTPSYGENGGILIDTVFVNPDQPHFVLW